MNASSSVENNNSNKPVTRVLALHGSEGSGDSFQKTLEAWSTQFNWDVTTVDGPVSKGNGWAWWEMPPGVRSYQATTYEHYESTSEPSVVKAIEKVKPHLIIGHSQGAILLTALLARGKIAPALVPPLGYILNGGAWPNPYGAHLDALQLAKRSSNNGHQSQRILVLSGTRDQVTDPAQSVRVAAALQRAGADVAEHRHPRGHAVPVTDAESTQVVQAWLSEQGNGNRVANL